MQLLSEQAPQVRPREGLLDCHLLVTEPDGGFILLGKPDLGRLDGAEEVRPQPLGWLLVLADVFWANWWLGASLTRSSSYALDPRNPIYRVLTPGLLIVLT